MLNLKLSKAIEMLTNHKKDLELVSLGEIDLSPYEDYIQVDTKEEWAKFLHLVKK